MPKPCTFPILYDELKTLSISFLKSWGYLNPKQLKIGTISWSVNGNKTGSIQIRVNTLSENPYLELAYKCNDTPINYRVQLVTVPSNLGKGVVWYFTCPNTGKRCRKLYLADTYFLHRLALTRGMHESQTRSKAYRQLDKTFGAYFRADTMYEQINMKHFKKQYAGKPTKKYLRIMQQIQEADIKSEF